MEQSPSSSGSEENNTENTESTAGYTLGGVIYTPYQTEQKVGDTIVGYRLLEVVGEGGGGLVYRAEQQEPFHRQVAVKVIKQGLTAEKIKKRFKAEIQALATLEHSYIARVYDADSTKEGQPYFAMEFVDGKRITDYADNNRLTIPKRLALFVKVCKAVHFAHERGFIHRDIKPSNILVTEEDGEPLPKLIDFGISKWNISKLGTGDTDITTTGQILGTLAYMSPEQAKSSNKDIDARTDNYSLGVLLYELLIGCVPFQLSGLGHFEQLRIIIEEMPEKPSEKFRLLNEDNALKNALLRNIDKPELINILQAGLDQIAIKCLEKNRKNRFETASGLATDVQRYLEGEQQIELKNENLILQNKSKAPRWPIIAFFAGFFAIVIVVYIVVLSPMILEHRKFTTNQEIYLITDNAGHASTFEGCQTILKQIDMGKITDPELASYVVMLKRIVDLFTEIGISGTSNSTWQLYKEAFISELPGSGTKVSSFRRIKDFLQLNAQMPKYEKLYKMLGERYGTKEIKDRIAKEYPTKPK